MRAAAEGLGPLDDMAEEFAAKADGLEALLHGTEPTSAAARRQPGGKALWARRRSKNAPTGRGLADAPGRSLRQGARGGGVVALRLATSLKVQLSGRHPQ